MNKQEFKAISEEIFIEAFNQSQTIEDVCANLNMEVSPLTKMLVSNRAYLIRKKEGGTKKIKTLKRGRRGSVKVVQQAAEPKDLLETVEQELTRQEQDEEDSDENLSAAYNRAEHGV